MELNYFETDKQIVSTFVRSDEKGGVTVGLSDEYASQGMHSMKIEWNTDGWVELVFVHFPEEWEEYTKFLFEIYNPREKMVNFELKLGDWFDSRGFYPKRNKYVFKAPALPGPNSYAILISDIAEKIDIKSDRKVVHLKLFDKNIELYLDNMRLEI